MNKKGTLLIVDDNKSILSALKILLSGIFDEIITLNTPIQLITTIREKKVDLVLLDMNFSSGINNGNEGLFWLNEIKCNFNNKCQVVLITAYADIDLAIEGMKSGANDFIVKPWDNNKLISTLKHAYEQTKQKPSTVSTTESETKMFWGTSQKMQELAELVKKVAVTDANILIFGENGTGKEVLASEIHRLSNRNKEPMVTVDMGAISETLFESELFGHTKGAFTDAKNDRPGKFEAANNSSLFLDEIGNLPLHMQAKLLTVLQRRKVIRLGSNQEIDINIRLISATNKDINQLIKKGDFRMDLMYRLNTIAITMPPLRECPEDIIPFCEMFMKKYSTKYNKNITGIHPEAANTLINYTWNGNVRELQHTVEKAVIMCTGTILNVNDFILQQNSPVSDSTNVNLSTFDEMEQSMIEAAIEKYKSNLSMVAQSLGVSRQTLYNKMKKYNM